MSKFIDTVMYYCYAHTWSLMDVLWIAVIIPALCNSYGYWMLLFVIPWFIYSNRQANKWNKWSE